MHTGLAYAGSTRVVELDGARIAVPTPWTEADDDPAARTTDGSRRRAFGCPDGNCKLILSSIPGYPVSGPSRALHQELHRKLEAELRPHGEVRVDALEAVGPVGSSRMTVERASGVTIASRTLSWIDSDNRMHAASAACAHRPQQAKACAAVLDSMSRVAADRDDERSMVARIASLTFNVLVVLAAIAVLSRLVRRRRR